MKPSQNPSENPSPEPFPLERFLVISCPPPEPSQNPSQKAVLPYDPLGVHPTVDIHVGRAGRLRRDGLFESEA